MNAVVVQFPAQNEIDEMGFLKAEIDKLQKRYDAIADDYRKKAPGKYNGEMFAVTVSEETLTTSFDSEKAKKKLAELGVDDEWINGNVKISIRKASIKVGAR